MHYVSLGQGTQYSCDLCWFVAKLHLLLLSGGVGLSLAADAQAGAKLYEANWKSLAAHQEVPEWYKDAKLGIYFHWGVYAVPAYGNEWYPRWMYFDGHKVFQHHVETYGHPSEFGYHNFVPMFKAENFDAGEWAALFRKTGARFAGPVAEHHDGFAMWKSEVTPWNVMDKGPERDITGELEQAIRAEGMKFITTFHHARNLQRLDRPGKPFPHRHHYRDSHYPPFDGMPTTTDDPELVQLYGRMPEEKWLEQMWLGKLKEVIDGYHPDLIWFDGWLDRIPEEKRQEFAAHYFNDAAGRNQDVVIARKEEDMPNEISVRDFEKGRANKLTENWWLTDDTISKGSWCYTEDLKIKPASEVLHVLIDIVSKRGVLLLNVSPMADGTIPQNQRDTLEGIGAWLRRYGEAVYDTRPWLVFGEGPSRLEKGGHFVKALKYSAADVRYTRSKDGSTIYASVLGMPKPSEEITLKSFSSDSIKGDLKVKNVSLLGSNEDIEFSQTDAGLRITAPTSAPDSIANVFKIDVASRAKLR